MGKIFILLGSILVAFGIIILLSEQGGFNIKWFSWFGKLPGDIIIERENFKFYFPLTSMILVSIVLSVLLKIIRKLL
ncbi:MAG TPA: DUF2905 domain-containing protein [Bacteroidia bacterium]|nr:DUF2905 domain-containing protein [Bacteroidia bacterium]